VDQGVVIQANLAVLEGGKLELGPPWPPISATVQLQLLYTCLQQITSYITHHDDPDFVIWVFYFIMFGVCLKLNFMQ